MLILNRAALLVLIAFEVRLAYFWTLKVQISVKDKQ